MGIATRRDIKCEEVKKGERGSKEKIEETFSTRRKKARADTEFWNPARETMPAELEDVVNEIS